MATRTRDTAPPGKEKRGTSPSPSPSPSPKRSTTNTSKTTSPVRKQADPTTTLNKNIPSYLKPTIAQSNKSASSTDLHNIQNNDNNKSSLLTRTRSFDSKPPLPSSSPKTRISPNPKERIPPSSKTSHKPLLDKFSKTSKDAIGKQRGAALNSKPVTKKKTATTIRKHDSTNGSTTKASVVTNSQVEQSEPEEDHQELTIHETEKEMNVSDGEMAANSDAGDNDSAVDDHEKIDGNVNNAELEEIKAAAESSSSIVEENQEIKIEENPQVEEAEEISNEPNETESEKEKEEEEEEEEEVTNVSSQELKEEGEGRNQEKEAAIIEETEAVQQQELCLNPKQVEETEAVPEKNTTAASSKPQHQVVQGKNKESVVSNNVIEETASKLREQRKNKVRALAGAFETVISLQDK